MQMRYAVLSGSGNGSDEAARVPTLDVYELNDREARDLRRDPATLALAPAMPVRLIAPLEAANAAPAGDSWGVAAVGAQGAPASGPGSGEGAVVAVLDTGIDAGHPAFAGVDLVRRDFTGAADADGGADDHGHGTHCAGTIFGRDVGGQRIGVARGVRRALIGKVLGGDGGGSSEAIARALTWAVQGGANVVSMSLGMDFPGLVAELVRRGLPPELATSRALEGYRANLDLFGALGRLAAVSGACLLVAAAGNESRRGENPDWEVGVAPPATAEGFVSVAAVGRGAGGLVVAPFSNTGATLAGPGVDIVSARVGGGLIAYSGTSMATPHVAGVTALWAERLGRESDLSRLTLDNALRAHATRAPLAGGVDRSDIGLGLVQAPGAA